MTPEKRNSSESRLLTAEELRRRCDPSVFEFTTTDDLEDCPIRILGQARAQEALRVGLTVRGEGYNIFVTGDVGSGRSTVTRRMLAEIDTGGSAPQDLVYVHSFRDPDQPRKLSFPAGRGRAFGEAMEELSESLIRDMPRLFESELYTGRRAQMLEAAGNEQKQLLRDFEKRVQSDGFALMQVPMGPLTRPHIVPVVAGNPIEMDQLENLIEEGQFKQEDYEKLELKLSELRGELEALGKRVRGLDRDLRRHLARLERELAAPLIEEAVAEVRVAFGADGLDDYLDEISDDLQAHLAMFRQTAESPDGAEGPRGSEADEDLTRYRANVCVDNSKTKGLPIIWESAPTYRNLFGTIEKARTGSGEWETDHTRIKAGSLLRANGGFLVLDAMDVLVEPAVWAALKRTLRSRKLSIQSFDPVYMMAGVSLKPEPVPIDVKVIMIGTRHIYRLLYALDEDFKKIFKVKAEFAVWMPFSDEELWNFACFVHKKIKDDDLPPFHRDAVAAIVEQAVRLAGHQQKLTTRFAEIADLIRESGFWAHRSNARAVRAAHVDRALEHRVYRVNLLEEMIRERIAEGEVLIDLGGEKVGQVNGLALLDTGDHTFCQPSRITATTAMGRAGIIDLEREAEMSGSIHTKGVLILTGFLRSRFAQHRPLALTATLAFEQNYGGIDGDSASSAELYALLSSLSGVPIRQGIAMTGSVNQRGEVQPIGGVNEKIEGYFDLCRVVGLSGEQGVMIPRRNVQHLMLRKDVVAAVRKGRFRIWAVETIEEGLEVLTGATPGERDADGAYPAETIFGAADARLRVLAEEVTRFGRADVGLQP